MVTKYNAELFVEERPNFVPEQAYSQTIELFKRIGLIGRFNVNHFGRFFPGYDDSCKLFRKGEFNFAPRDIEETPVEMLESWFPKTEAEEELKALGWRCLEILTKRDPSFFILPQNISGQFPMANSMELVTPYGRQSVHFHTDDEIYCGEIQLWRPKKDEFWYDFDFFKNYLQGFWARNWNIDDDKAQKGGFFKRLKIAIEQRGVSRLSKLYEKLVLDPDPIEKVPSFVK